MKFVLLLGSVAAASAATCSSVGSGPRAKAFVCPSGFSANAANADAECPEDGCTKELCCESTVVARGGFVVEKPKGPSEVSVGDFTGPTCGRVTGGSRGGRYVCTTGVFDVAKFQTACDGACTDELCCTTPVDQFNCNTKEVFSPAKAAFCCEEAGIGCAPRKCAAGAGILSDDGTTCCHRSCGTCGGVGCYEREGGPACCKTLIAEMGRPCSLYSAPCSTLAMLPVPAPLPVPMPRPMPVPMPAPFVVEVPTSSAVVVEVPSSGAIVRPGMYSTSIYAGTRGTYRTAPVARPSIYAGTRGVSAYPVSVRAAPAGLYGPTVVAAPVVSTNIYAGRRGVLASAYPATGLYGFI